MDTPSVNFYIHLVSFIILLAYISWLILLTLIKNSFYLNDSILIETIFRKIVINLNDVVSLHILEDLPPSEPSYKIYDYVNLAFYGLLTALTIAFMLVLDTSPIYMILTAIILVGLLFMPYNLLSRRYVTGIISGVISAVLIFLFSASINMIPHKYYMIYLVLMIIIFVFSM